VIKPCRF